MNKLAALPQKAWQHISEMWSRASDNRVIHRKADEIGAHVPPARDIRPVIFFKASTGATVFTLNNAFHILAAWGMRLQRVPVIHFACNAGMSKCIMGTVRTKPHLAPPCKECTAHSKAMFSGANIRWFGFSRSAAIANALKPLSVPEMLKFQQPLEGLEHPIPLGELVAPGLRWILRRHNLKDDEETRQLCREYILSAWNVANEFMTLLDQTDPQAVLVFNGQFFPEATARWIAKQRGIRCITQEVGLQPYSVFFTEGEATAYPIDIPDSFDLNDEQNARLDAYLEKRFKGKFSMAGIKFWPEMKGLDEAFLQKIGSFKQIVPVFTNVIFDTSQPHANTVFSDMFAWLDAVLEIAKNHPETLFVIRAHPDETRPGKEALETVAGWVAERAADQLPNVVFIAPHEYLSSYELIQRSKFVMIYNSTIGMEATIMGAPVLSAGKARFTQYPSVFFPPSVPEYLAKVEEFLTAEKIEVPAEFPRNARRFLYYQLYRTSLPMERFLTTGRHPSLTRFSKFGWEDLTLEKSPAMATIYEGLLENGDFLLKE